MGACPCRQARNLQRRLVPRAVARDVRAAAHLDRMGPIGGIEFLPGKLRQNERDSDFFDGGRVQALSQRTAAKEPKPNAAVAVFNTC